MVILLVYYSEFTAISTICYQHELYIANNGDFTSLLFRISFTVNLLC